ncbi:MAG: spherulation-specific family 4 protein [Candidatus Xenobia bacterium]
MLLLLMVTRAHATGVLVPLYAPPGDPQWDALLTAHDQHPGVRMVVIVNPNSGPGAQADPAWAALVSRLSQAGVEAIGYVSTGLTAKRPAADVVADIERYRQWYPGLAGIFLDEMTNPDGIGTPDYYSGLSDKVKSLGYQVCIGNAGTGIGIDYVVCVDTIVIYENRGLPDLDALGGWTMYYPASHFAALAYNVPLSPDLVAAAAQHIGLLYFTDAAGANPWQRLPPYFNDLLDLLAPEDQGSARNGTNWGEWR